MSSSRPTDALRLNPCRIPLRDRSSFPRASHHSPLLRRDRGVPAPVDAPREARAPERLRQGKRGGNPHTESPLARLSGAAPGQRRGIVGGGRGQGGAGPAAPWRPARRRPEWELARSERSEREYGPRRPMGARASRHGIIIGRGNDGRRGADDPTRGAIRRRCERSGPVPTVPWQPRRSASAPERAGRELGRGRAREPCASVPAGATVPINLHCPPAWRNRSATVGADAKGRE